MLSESPAPVPHDDSVLAIAHRAVHGDRHDDYGHPAEDFTRVATMWSALFGFDVPVEKVPMAMICVKLSRLVHDPTKRDSTIDIAGYAETLDMVLTRMQAEGP